MVYCYKIIVIVHPPSFLLRSDTWWDNEGKLTNHIRLFTLIIQSDSFFRSDYPIRCVLVERISGSIPERENWSDFSGVEIDFSTTKKLHFTGGKCNRYALFTNILSLYFIMFGLNRSLLYKTHLLTQRNTAVERTRRQCLIVFLIFTSICLAQISILYCKLNTI